MDLYHDVAGEARAPYGYAGLGRIGQRLEKGEGMQLSQRGQLNITRSNEVAMLVNLLENSYWILKVFPRSATVLKVKSRWRRSCCVLLYMNKQNNFSISIEPNQQQLAQTPFSNKLKCRERKKQMNLYCIVHYMPCLLIQGYQSLLDSLCLYLCICISLTRNKEIHCHPIPVWGVLNITYIYWIEVIVFS